MRIHLTLTLALTPLGVAPAQYDAKAPEPVAPLGGTVVLAGSDGIPDAAIMRFVRIAGGKQAKVALLGVNADLRRWRKFVDNVFAFDPAEGQLAPLAGCKGIWVHFGEGRAMPALWPKKRLVARMREVLASGGVVGAGSRAAPWLGEARLLASAPGLALLPRAVVASSRGARLEPLLAYLGKHPGLVGLHIEPQTAVFVERRSVFAVGAGVATALLAKGNAKPPRSVRIAGRTRADWIALTRDATARAGAPFPPKPAPKPNVEKGTLVIVGGGGMPPGLMQRFIELAGGAAAPIVYVPCTSAKEVKVEPGMVRALRRAGARDVTWVHTKDRHEADTDPAILGKLRRARGIWFGGGRQWNLVDSWQNTKAHELMEQVLAKGGVIGGSSAGASIQCDYLCRGDPLGNLDIIAPGYETGLGFLRGAGVDQHFSQRGREPDMLELMRTYPWLLGIGLDEASAIVVQKSVAEVVAQRGRFAHFFDWTADAPFPVVLAHGGRYDLAARKRIGADAAASLALVAGVWQLISPNGRLQRKLTISKDGRGSYEGGGRTLKIARVRLDRGFVSFDIVDKSGMTVFAFAGLATGQRLSGQLTAGSVVITMLAGTKPR